LIADVVVADVSLGRERGDDGEKYAGLGSIIRSAGFSLEKKGF
jgi:hypothetical protein